MLGYWNYTVWLTFISVILATLGVGICIYNPNHATDYAIICLLFCGFFDMFDGKVARTKKDRTEREKNYGIQIDTLSDLVAFGILPASIGYRLLDGVWKNWYSVFFIAIIALYVLFGLIRLGYFNSLEIERAQAHDESVLKAYTGMPITMAAFFIPIVYMFSFVDKLDSAFKYIYLASLAVIGLLFVLKIKVPKAGKKMIIGFTIFGVILLTCFTLLMVL